MSYRQHIAVVNTKKAAVARLLPYQHFIIPDFDRSQHPEMTDEEADSAEFEVMEAQNAKTEFYNIINEYDVKTCMKRTAKDSNKLVKIASWCYLIHPSLFYYAIVHVKR